MKSILPNWSIRALLALILLVSAETVKSQVSILTLPYAKSDNFNAYNPTNNAATAAGTLPTGWTLSGATNYNGRGTGTSNTGGYYAYGLGTDFSLGSLRSGSLTITYAVNFTNNSGTTITDLTISWNYEQWRFANNSGWNVTGTGALASNATLNAKDFVGASSGTSGATTPVASFTLTGLSIASGQSFGIKWDSTDGNSSDNGVSIDDFSISASGTVMQDQTITFDALANATYGDSNITLTGSASSNLTVSYTSSNTNVATVSGNTLTIVGAGATNITASQSGNASYNAAANVIQALTVNPKNLTATNAVANSKVYDRNTSATISGATAFGTVNGDVITITGGGTFVDFNAGNGKPVTAALSLSGAKASSYTLTQPTGLTANITQKDVTVNDAEAQNKIFDGNTNAIITGTLNGVISPDVVTFNGTGTFASSAAAQGIAVTSTSTIGGNDAANYTLVQPVGLTANIYAEALTPQTITFNPLANVTYGDANFNLNATASSGLTVTYASSNEEVATVSGNTVTVVGAGSTTITATQQGNGTFEEAIPVTQTLTVNPKALTIDNAVANDKIYNGNNNATFTGVLNGIINADVVTLNATGTFSSVTVANGISVTSTATLDGADVSNYTLTQPTGLSADITPKTITANSVTASNKVYDGNTNATLNNFALTGVIAGDEVTASGSGTFASAAVANGISVTTALNLGGADAFNYVLTQPSGITANITRLALTISGLTGNDKVYDRSTAATLDGTPVLSGFLLADDVFVSGAPVANFNTRTVGTNKTITVTGYTLSGADANNYSATQPTGITADITPASVTISGAVAQDKPFDGTNSATITGTLSGVISADAVTLVGTGTFASSAVGTDIAVTSTSTLTGNDAGNYIINPQPTGLSADILVGPTVLNVGDLSIIGFNVNTPDNFAFVTWVDINPDTYIKFTDNPFFSAGDANLPNNVRGGEQFVMWRNNGATIPAGTVITISDAPATNFGTIVSGSLNGLSGSGDNIFAYQGAATSGTFPDFASNGNPTTFNGNILFGLYLQGTNAAASWLTNQATTVTTNNSFLPSELNVANGNIALGSNATRGQYTGSRSNQLTLEAYKALVTSPSNWTTGSGSGTTITLNTASFTLAAAPTASAISGAGTICAGDTANLNVSVTGGLSPFTITYSDGTTEFTVNNYASGSNIPVTPSTTTSYTLVSVVDANGLTGNNNTGTATINVNQFYPFFADSDGDGYGTGNPVSVCAVDAQTPPDNFATLDGDCNDEIAAINPGEAEVLYNGIDDNCDGSLDEGFKITTTLLASSCGRTLPAIGSLVQIQTIAPASTITAWRIRATNGAQVQVIEKNVPHFTMLEFPSYNYATTYTIDIELQRNGVWLGYYGPTCFVSTPAILENGGAGSINPSQCGLTLAQINTVIATTSLQGVTGYRYRITNLTDPVEPNAVQTIDRTQHWFTLQMLERYNYGTTYRIEVAVKSTGGFGGFGAPCEISSPAVPSLLNCGGSVATGTTLVKAASVAGATQYRFQITRQSDNASSTIDRSTNYFTFNMVPAAIFTAGATYNVRVAVMSTLTWSPFGDACEIVAPGGAAKGAPIVETATPAASVAFKASVYPNPFTTDFDIDIISSATENVQVKVYDMLGRLMESKTVEVSEKVHQLGNNYPSGVYNVIVNQNGTTKTLRVIKR